MKKYLKITILFALTVVIVATMCILPTFAAYVEETVTITDKIQLQADVTYSEIVFDFAANADIDINYANNVDPWVISCGGTLTGYDSIDEETVYKTIDGISYTSDSGFVKFNVIINGVTYPFYSYEPREGEQSYVKINIPSSSDNITVEGLLLTDILLTNQAFMLLPSFIGDSFSASYTDLVEVPDPPTPTDSITGIFTNISGWIVTAIGNTVPMFYNAQAAELTILGVLAVVGLAIAVIFLLINVIKRFIQFRS